MVGLLAEPERLRVVSALALGAGTIGEVAAAAGLDQREVVRALRRLERSGLVSRDKDRLTLHAERFKQAAQEAAPDEPGEPLSADPATDAVLRAFTRDGRITSIPVRRGRRRLLLEHVAAAFEPGVRYPERRGRRGPAGLVPGPRHAAPLPRRRAVAGPGRGDVLADGGPVALDPPAPEQIQRVAAYGLVRDGGRVLLTRLGRSMHKGLWTLPGGGVDFGERPVDAVVRELHEETGLDVAVDELLDADAEIYRDTRPDHRYEVHAVRFLYRLTRARRHARRGRGRRLHRRGAVVAGGELPRLTPLAERVLRTGRLSP